VTLLRASSAIGKLKLSADEKHGADVVNAALKAPCVR